MSRLFLPFQPKSSNSICVKVGLGHFSDNSPSCLIAYFVRKARQSLGSVIFIPFWAPSKTSSTVQHLTFHRQLLILHDSMIDLIYCCTWDSGCHAWIFLFLWGGTGAHVGSHCTIRMMYVVYVVSSFQVHTGVLNE